MKKLNTDYHTLLTKDSLNAEVADIYKFPFGYRFNPNHMRITTSYNKKFSFESGLCLNYGNTKLAYELHIGDSIKKASGSDTLVVINSKGKYLFKLEASE